VQPIRANFTANQYTAAYNSIMSNIESVKENGNDLTLEDYKTACNIVLFDLTPDNSAEESHKNVSRTGSVRVEIHFEKALPQSITAIIFGEFISLIEIDRFRNISLDYAT
jgi:hypothetical protein